MTKLFLKLKKDRKNEVCPARLGRSGGFTIMEMMVAIAVFLIVITAGMGALLNSYRIHKKTQGMRSIMDNLTFVMEDMSRSIRVGTNFHCQNGNMPLLSPLPTVLDCPSGGRILTFKNQDGIGTGYGIYGGNSGEIVVKSVAGETLTSLVPAGIYIDSSASNFTVIGSTPQNSDGSGDSQQPVVIIKLSGTITYQGTTTPFSLRTVVSQRALDIAEPTTP